MGGDLRFCEDDATILSSDPESDAYIDQVNMFSKIDQVYLGHQF